MSTSRRSPLPGTSKKISSWVRPGVCEVRASALRPVSALIRLDLPTLERPAKAISSPAIGGSVAIEGEAQMNCQSRANSFRPASISSASVSSVMRAVYPLVMAGLVPAIHVYPQSKRPKRDARDKPGHDDVEAIAPYNDDCYVAFFANVALRLSNSSTFTPLRRMMKHCWSTESVLFHAQ